MALDSYGYRFGDRIPVKMPVDSSTSDITAGDILAWGTAGYVQQGAAAQDIIAGVAMESCASPSADGDASILVDISESTVYEYPADTGSVTEAIRGTTMDVGGARSVNIDASADDVVVCVGVDTVANTVHVTFKTTSKYAGVA